MSDLHELIESLRVLLASSLTPKREELNDLHGRISDAIRHANKRLRECDELLANGHRSEAIQLAEQEPNLLDVVSILDFAELPEWNDFVAELGLKVAPELEIDIAGDLNHAYSDSAPLERYLRRLRVYSLGRAPLRTRIDLMRKIIKVDSADHWKEDLRSYEEVRLRQIGDDVRLAAQKRNFDQLTRLSDELNNKPWAVKPEAQVVNRVRKALDGLRAEHSLTEMWDLLRELAAARENEDIGAASALISHWNSLARECDRSGESFGQLQSEAAPILAWVKAEHARRESAERETEEIEKLRRLTMSPRVTAAELDRHYSNLAGNPDIDLPEDIAARCRARIDELRRRDQLTKKLKLGGVVLAVLTVVVLLVIAFR